MVEREEQLRQALRTVDPEWSSKDTEQGIAMLRVRLRRRVTTRLTVVFGVAALVCLWVAWPYVRHRSRAAVGEESGALDPNAQLTRFSDGSTMTRLGPGALVSVVEARPDRIVASVERGLVRFEVTPRPSRVFRAEAANVSVEALGTAFTVERKRDEVGVNVLHGRVRVTWMTGTRELGAGEMGWFPPREDDTTAEMPRTGSPEARSPSASGSEIGSSGTAPGARAPSWKALALEGRNEEAFALLRERGSSVKEADDLMLAADVARLSGHPADAAPYLERLLKDAKGSPRAAVAAFDLGRILMTSLGRPREAAEKFAEAERRAKGGSLAEDALAREVEAWARAGAADRARERAEEYLRRYPAGQRSRAVRTFGGIE